MTIQFKQFFTRPKIEKYTRCGRLFECPNCGLQVRFYHLSLCENICRGYSDWFSMVSSFKWGYRNS